MITSWFAKVNQDFCIIHTYHKQQKLYERKLSQFLRIIDESQKFFLLIDFAVKEKSYYDKSN